MLENRLHTVCIVLHHHYKQTTLALFCRRANQELEKLSNLLQVTQILCGRTGFEFRLSELRVHAGNHSDKISPPPTPFPDPEISPPTTPHLVTTSLNSHQFNLVRVDKYSYIIINAS